MRLLQRDFFSSGVEAVVVVVVVVAVAVAVVATKKERYFLPIWRLRF